MIPPKEIHNEQERLKELWSYNILDSVSEQEYDDITQIAANICGTHVSLITLIDKQRQWFKSHHGLEITETPREIASCAHAIHEPNSVFIVEDARNDVRFSDNPLVVGNPYVIFYAGMPLVNANGYALGTLCVIDDKPKKLNTEQINALKALSRQVVVLLELRRKKAQLEEAMNNLEDKNKQFENFSLQVAHDLKAPLNNIVGITDILMDNAEQTMDEFSQKLIKNIKEASTELKNLVDDIFNYNMSEKIAQESKSEISLKQLKKDMENLFLIDENNCTIQLQTSLTHITANKSALKQILANLISNAIKYNDKEAVWIEIGISETDTAYEIYVKDNGMGIAPEQQQKIFDLLQTFNKLDRFGKRGRGIGLASVKKLVEDQGGAITVESELQKGTTMIFSLKK